MLLSVLLQAAAADCDGGAEEGRAQRGCFRERNCKGVCAL